jgi:hypothetical protein
VSCKQYFLEPYLIKGRVRHHDAEAGVYPNFEKKKKKLDALLENLQLFDMNQQNNILNSFF